ncbi:hypothetical protein SEVIR_4G074000v4 [Setaria viridis]|uniref:Uncharacterized protein n=2 Tax=Setaria TaxID=4554 RepID=A0A368QRU6_SETIT|nr:uncharacterized protein LOC101757687 [Setaria italica]XP_012700598.1 uncharacterized protein LOC101757687 [Setaria italica]XP_034592060.1 uncharacterized protein LOC117853890 [Setaria viridis]XP_034592062.1 uncharacterized protein LOC117853890 [Setaria viridis]RCV20679.1 hypothetical protein SETIT_4G076000v2 [Setaria italica]TKW20252.1 hypothetical protein SEVIR_4G074000v2 [Setaria viridis]
MLTEALAAAFADLWAAITAIQLYYSINLQPGAGATTTATSADQTAASVGDFQIFLTLVAAGGLYAAVALVYRSLHQAEAAGAGGGDRRPSDLVAFIFAAAGVLEYFLFVDDVGALGLAAARVLPAASIGTFFLGMVLIILVHIRAGGEGGCGAVVGDGPIQAPVWIITKMAFAAAAGLVALMAIALCPKY